MNHTTDFQIRALSAEQFNPLFDLNDAALAKIGATRMIVNKNPGFPCRVSLEDAEVGEEVILLPFEHHSTTSPYRASGPIFIRKGAAKALVGINEIPNMLLHRLLSVRAYDEAGCMQNAVVVEGNQLQTSIQELLNDETVAYLHIHNAKPGCYNCLVERAVKP